MSELKGQVGELHFTVQIKRKETGKVETFELVGRVAEDEAQEPTVPADEEQAQ